MGPLFNEIRYSVFNKVKPMYSDDDAFGIQLVGHIVNNMRSQLMKDRYEKQGFLEPQFYQFADSLEVVCSKVTGMGVWGGDSELIVDVPQLSGMMGHKAVSYLGSPDRKNPYRYVTFNNVEYVRFEKYTGNAPCWTLLGNRIYIRNPVEPGLGTIAIAACFDIPYVTVEGKVTADVNDPLIDYEYPLPNILVNKLELLAYNDLIQSRKDRQQAKEEVNNAKDDNE